MTYILLVLFLIILVINYLISGRDFFNPAVVFCFMNFLSSLICAIAAARYEFTIHANTVGVLTLGAMIFTLVNFFVELANKNNRKTRESGIGGNQLSYIVIRRYWVIFIIIFEIVVAYFAAKYVRNVVRAYDGVTYSFSTSIGRYNSIVKNHGERFRNLGVSAGAVYSYGWPLCCVLCVLLGAIAVNNYILTKKLDKLIIISILIPVITSLFTGSRSNAFRFITAFICEYIVLYRHYTGNYKRGTAKMLRRLLLIAIAVVLGFTSVLSFMGRIVMIDPAQYFVAYLGGPFMNLDIYLQNPYHSSFFGQETFQRFYAYLGSRLGIGMLRYDLNLPYNRWNGIYLGNVYTMYYMFIEDFGLWGIIPLTTVCAYFYCAIYSRLMNLNIRRSIIGPTFLIYAYLFNDVIMLTFSNRFYENVLRSTTIRIYFWLIPLWYFYKKGLFRSRVTLGRRYSVIKQK